jgi:hypothetical protein
MNQTKQEMIIFANSAGGTHCGSLTRMAAVAIGKRNLLVAPVGADSIQLATGNLLPFGTVADEAAEGDLIAVQLLGGSRTITMAAAAAIPVGAPVVNNGDGQVKELPTAAGSYVQVGLAVDSAAAGETVEVLSCCPRVVVISE